MSPNDDLSSSAEFFRIVLATIGVAIGYAMLHDLVTIHLCPEYFLIAHAPVFPFESMLALALAWGASTGALAGIPVGFLVAAAAQNGRRRQPIPLGHVMPSLLLAVAIVSGAAFLAGVLGFIAATLGWAGPAGLAALDLPDLRVRPFVTVWAAHGAAYVAGFLGLLVVLPSIWLTRPREGPSKSPSFSLGRCGGHGKSCRSALARHEPSDGANPPATV